MQSKELYALRRHLWIVPGTQYSCLRALLQVPYKTTLRAVGTSQPHIPSRRGDTSRLPPLGLYQLGSAPKHGHTLRAAPEGHPGARQRLGGAVGRPGGPEGPASYLVTSVPSVVPTSTDRAPSLTRRDKIPFTRSASTTRPNRVSTHIPQGDLPISTPSQPQPRIAHAHHRKLWPRRMPVLLTFR